MKNASGQPEFPINQALRGIAALAVCWYHFTAWNVSIPPGWTKSSGTYGYLGVEAFFVISGFIVPYSLLAAGYRFSSFFKFLGKRFLRVDPPYLASVAFTVAAAWLAHMKTGAAPHYTPEQIALNLGYLIPFSKHQAWINGVYWTLAVEFQYYLVLGLIFPALLAHRPAVRRFAFAAALGASLLTRSPSFLPAFMPLFLLGIAGLCFVCQRISGKELAVMAAACTALGLDTAGVDEACMGLGAFVCILRFRSAPGWLLGLGKVSYSLYLIHVPVGIRVESLAAHFIPPRDELFVPLCAVLVSMGCAWVMHLAIERPAMRWASRIKYTPHP
jgi:peptidoglycan/LPS O-acetylase OafA/YrhL